MRAGLILTVLLTLVAGPVLAKKSLRCGGELVRLGDGQWQVERVCGEPDYRHRQDAVRIPSVGTIGAVDEWYYNRGPQQLVRVLYFRDGDLDRIAEAGYGFSRGLSQGNCSPYRFEKGLSKYQLLRICGEPAYRDTRWRLLERGGVQRVDEWVYEFGSNQYPRELEFVDGRLDTIEVVR